MTLTDALVQSAITIGDLASKADVATRVAANALSGRPVASMPYLRICRAINFDPAPTLEMQCCCGADFDFAYFAMALKIARALKTHSTRQAAKAIGVGASTICRAERGEPTQIGVVLSICRYVGVHPFGYMREVSRETFAETAEKRG